MVHEFCKLFGYFGVPEYGCGATKFVDFLHLKSEDQTLTKEISSYYTSCVNIVFDCQVGNRYFITASNTAKAVFLKISAVEFLKFTDKGNKLKRDVLFKVT